MKMTTMKYILALISVILVLGCVSTTQNNTNSTGTEIPADFLTVANGYRIAVDYTGMFENGTIFDSSVGGEPLEFDAGEGQMIKGFDDAVIGMQVGEEKTVTIKPEDAYGLYDAKKIIEFPVSRVPNNTKVGDTLYSGPLPVRVVAINSTNVTIDINHPLAGKTLIFSIKIVKIEKL